MNIMVSCRKRIIDENKTFDISKYEGIWYELIHYPSWFQRNDNYNTKAEYRIIDNDKIEVINSTISHGKNIESKGIGYYLGGFDIYVDFSFEEINKLESTNEFNIVPESFYREKGPNYVIDRIWLNNQGMYMYAIVTDPERKSLYVLSRVKNPPLSVYNEIMNYVVNNYNRDLLVQTPHFD